MNIGKNKITYIAGPITGIKDFNYPAFYGMEERLRELGVEQIFNPAKNPKDPYKTSWKEFMKDALDMVMKSEQVVFLNGWENSKGAQTEMALAKGLCLDIFFEQKESILQEADRIVSCDRQNDYGHPIEDFTRTGKLWATILDIEKVEPEQVGMCMIALKLSRLCNAYKRDSAVDIGGYAKTIDMVMDKKKELMLR